MALELSIWSAYYIEHSAEDAIKRLRDLGVCYTELSDEHGAELLNRSDNVVETGKKFGEYARSIGMNIPQGHLWLACRIVTDPEAVNMICKWIDLYEAIGIKNMVLHVQTAGMEGLCREEIIAANVEKLKNIAAHAEGRDVYICLENLGRPGANSIKDLLEMIEAVGSDRLAVTLDTGHLNIAKTSTQRDFILAAGKRLKALHIADNEGQTDQHMMPFGRGNVDFGEVIRTLREIGYDGILNYEIPGENHCPLEVRDMKVRYIIESHRYMLSL